MKEIKLASSGSRYDDLSDGRSVWIPEGPDVELTIGVPNKGRLLTGVEDFFRRCGFNYQRTNRQAVTWASITENIGFWLAFLRPRDIVNRVISGDLNAGIVGSDIYLEENKEESDGFVDDTSDRQFWWEDLPFGNCRLSLAVPRSTFEEDWQYRKWKTMPNIYSYEGKRIATSYPNIVNRYLRKRNISADLVVADGGIEGMVKMGWADAIVDLVETGQSLRANGFAESDIVTKCRAIFFTNTWATDAQGKWDPFVEVWDKVGATATKMWTEKEEADPKAQDELRRLNSGSYWNN